MPESNEGFSRDREGRKTDALFHEKMLADPLPHSQAEIDRKVRYWTPIAGSEAEARKWVLAYFLG